MKGLSHFFQKADHSPGAKHLQRGKSACDSGDFARAKQELEQAIALGLDSDCLLEAYSSLGAAHFQLKEIDQAIADFARTVELAPQSRRDWNNLGVACWLMGDLDRAIYAHQQALQLDPSDANAYCDLGAVFLAKGQPQQAIEALEKSLQLNSHLPVAHSNLAVAYAYITRFEEAYTSISQAASNGYSDVVGLKFQVDLIKTLYVLRGEDTQRSWLDLLEEAKLDPDNADMTSLRYAYALSGDYDPYYRANGLELEIEKAAAAVEAQDWNEVIQVAKRVLATNYMHLGIHWNIITAYLEKGMEEQAVPHQHFMRSCLRSVHQSGYGDSYRTAYVVVSLDEEYMFLRFFGAMEGFEYQGQRRLVEHAGHAFDVFDIRQVKTGQNSQIYFNVDLLFESDREGRAEQSLEERMNELFRSRGMQR